jgi:hypothetical protein
MGVVGSLPSPVSLTSENNTSHTQNTVPVLNEQPLPSNDELKANINYDVTLKNDIDHQRSARCNYRTSKQYTVVSYGLISVRRSHRSTPTLNNGRCSKFLPLEGEAAIKRELRREKNRKIARKLKEKRIGIERQLENEIHQLEFIGNNLLNEINNLKSYKQFLEERCQQEIWIEKQMIQTTLLKSSHVEYHRRQLQKNISSHYDFTQTEMEPTSVNAQWPVTF